VWILMAGLALAGNKYEGRDPNIEVQRDLAISAEAAYEHLTNLVNVARIYPGGCSTGWEVTPASSHNSARFRVNYRIGLMRRKLGGSMSKATPSELIVLDHEGNKGFKTKFFIEAREGGSTIKMVTALLPPPWPTRGYFFKKLQPMWQDCQTQTLINLEQAVQREMGGTGL